MNQQIQNLKKGSVVAATAVTGTMINVGSAFAQISDGVDASRPTGAAEDLFNGGGIFQIIADTLLFLVGAVSVIMLIIGGIRYVISAGDQQAVTNAKNTILYAIVGIVVAFLAFAAVRFVTGRLDGTA